MTGRSNAGRVNPIIAAGAAVLRIRWIVRTPIWLFRARLGFVFGSRLLMLEHVGRVSGRRRYVVLEVVDHPAADRYVVVSGFGEHAQWFRNVTANPQVRVYLAGHLPALVIASRLDSDPAAAALSRYAAAHPRSWAKLRPVLEQTLGARINEHDKLPVIVIELVDPARHCPRPRPVADGLIGMARSRPSISAGLIWLSASIRAERHP